ncbi:WD repeat-containing protein 91 [Daktulosphaira vitifoliae]|uniref:WD repeat-containing protein 91 n=1 Tax=Daktulosphaira vitifoliae TaxID=58002 RepID=UPI0021AA4E2D|nr:WD repeat-containing protein 91 [Daktulosphaira vitifoliae]
MPHMQHIDELIREYLLFRGFTNSLKWFDFDIKADKDKGFRVDKLVDQILQLVYSYDFTLIRELWSHFENKLFSKLDHDISSAVKKLENSLLKFYVVHAIINNRSDKVNEFLIKMTNDLQTQAEWKDWFMLPYLKNVEENPLFAIYFTKQWQDSFFVSLHNFLSIVYQIIPRPRLCQYEEDANKIKRLQDEIDILKQKLTEGVSQPKYNTVSGSYTTKPPIDIIDDFYTVSQETIKNTDTETSMKSLRTLIRTIGGLPTSPILGKQMNTKRVPQHIPTNTDTNFKKNFGNANSKLSSSLSTSPSSNVMNKLGSTIESSRRTVSKRSISLERDSIRNRSPRDTSLDNLDKKQQKVPPFLLLSQESFNEHKSKITQCRFNLSGSLIASSDSDGCLKIWTAAPSPKVIGSTNLKKVVFSLDWLKTNDRFILLGCDDCTIILYDAKEMKILWELNPFKQSSNLRIQTIKCSPTDSTFVCSLVSKDNNKLLLYDLKTKKMERQLILGNDDVAVTCCSYNHNGQLLYAGCTDGSVRTVDLRHSEIVDRWTPHTDCLMCLQLSPDHNDCYTLGADKKICRTSMNGNKQSCVWEVNLKNDNLLQSNMCLNQAFTIDQSGSYMLLSHSQNNGGNIYKITSSGLSIVLSLKEHRSFPIVCDWSSLNQCGTCVTGSDDGTICISTLLTP